MTDIDDIEAQLKRIVHYYEVLPRDASLLDDDRRMKSMAQALIELLPLLKPPSEFITKDLYCKLCGNYQSVGHADDCLVTSVTKILEAI